MSSTEKYFHSNEAINHLDDDLFKFGPYASKIQESIRNSCISDEPLIFGIYGKWGEGKSSFMNLIYKDLEVSTEPTAKKIIKYRFNPWRYQSEDMLIVQFFKGLIKVINSDYSDSVKSDLTKKIKKYASAILSGAKVEVETGLNLGIKSTVKATYNFKETLDKLEGEKEDIESQKEEIDNILKEHKFKIVIFLDDIDRLNKEELYLVFRLLKLIAYFKNLIYVIALDDEMVAKAIYQKYGDDINDGKLYLEKIVNIPITLPNVEPQDILKEIKKGLKNIFTLNKIEIDELNNSSKHNYNTGTNRFLKEIDGIEKHIKTPRMMYRLLNSFYTNLIALKEEVNYADLLWLELLKLKYLKVYNYVKQNPNLFIKHGTIESVVNNSRSNILNTELQEIVNTQSDLKYDNVLIHIIIDKLFPLEKRQNVVDVYISNLDESYQIRMDSKLSNIERRINHSDFFRTYFNFNTIGKISNLDLEQLLNLIYSQDENLDNQFDDFISKNNTNTFIYEAFNKLEQVDENQKRFLLIKFLLSKTNTIVNDNDSKNDTSRTIRNQFVQNLFKNTFVLDFNQKKELVDEFIVSAEIDDFLYLRNGLSSIEFKNSELQNEIDFKMISKVKEVYKNSPFFNQFDSHIVRAIFSIWNSLNSEEFNNYISEHLDKNTVLNFIKCFPTIWEDSNGKHFEGFDKDNYNFLKSLINPKIVADIIIESFSNEIKKYELEGDKIWLTVQNNEEELRLLAQFMKHYNEDRKKLLIVANSRNT